MYPPVGFFASPNRALVAVVISFIQKGFPVVIVSTKVAEWRQILSENNLANQVKIENTRHSFPYEIVIDTKDLTNYDLFISKPSPNNRKSLVISNISNFSKLSPVRALYFVEILTKGSTDGLIGDLTKSRLTFETYYFIFVEDLINALHKELFSYGSGISFLLSRRINANDLIQKIKTQFNRNIKLAGNNSTALPDLPFYPLTEIDLLEAIMAQVPPLLVKAHKSITPSYPLKIKPKNHSKSNRSQYVIFGVISAIWFFITPFILLFVSTFSLWRAQYSFQSGKNTSASSLISIATSTAKASKNIFNLYSYVPIVGTYIIPVRDAADYIYQGGFIAQRMISIIANTQVLLKGVLAGQNYDVTKISQDLYLDFDTIYSEIAFLEGDIKGFNRNLFNLYPRLSQVFSNKRHLAVARSISKNLPEILGVNGSKTYMVLFQNNMELRPTGGFIGSFGLITFENGKLIDTVVYDVYEADGQLKGFVAPPRPISDYLGEETWYLRDSNWDIHFPKSAERAEWFLDKTLDRDVDGVIGINLEAAKKILTVTGPVVLLDFKDEITADNMYEKVQREVENDFFSGSKKKANYLTALSKTLIERIKNVKESEYMQLAQEMWGSLEARDIQIALHNDEVSTALKDSNWDGGVNLLGCGNFCKEIPIGLVEANLGVNKANYYIKRSGAVTLELSASEIVVKQSITITNNAKTGEKIPERRYKTYIRSINPLLSKAGKVQIQDSVSSYWINPESQEVENRVEDGVLVEINPGQSKTITFSSTIPYGANPLINALELSIRKQSGVNAYPLTIDILSSDNQQIHGLPAFTLTGERIYRYNTNLSEDITRKIYW